MLKIFLLLSMSLSLTLSSTAQKKVNIVADIILYNGKIWTGNKTPAFVDAVAIKGNKILQTGATAAIKRLAGRQTYLVDLKGKLVTAGFNDAHTHFLGGSLGLTGIDLYESKNLGEALIAIEQFAKKHPEKKWLTGMGWQYNIFENGMPEKKALDQLDAISNGHPIYLNAYDGHSIWVNSVVLKMAGITGKTTFAGFGEIIKDANGEPTGALTEGAGSLVSKIVPLSTRAEELDALREGMKYAKSHGITSIQNASGSIAEFALYQALLKKGELTLRSSTAFSAGKNTTEKDIQQFIQVKNSTYKNPLLSAGCIKFMLDGVIESHTAAMLEPYSDVPADSKKSNSDFALPLNIYRSLLTRFDKEGFQIYTHAIGDKSVREALNAYENARKINGTTGRRHRIEHIEQTDPEDLPRFAKLGVMASMEPIHADPGTIDVWAKAVGEKRLSHSFVWASMLKNKAHLVFSSDWPACITPDPVRGLHNAVNRQSIDGTPHGGWVPEQKISVTDAMIAYTQGGAYSSKEENSKGKILPGYLADIIVFSQNLFKIPSSDIYKTKVLLTIFNGKVIYDGGAGIK